MVRPGPASMPEEDQLGNSAPANFTLWWMHYKAISHPTVLRFLQLCPIDLAFHGDTELLHAVFHATLTSSISWLKETLILLVNLVSCRFCSSGPCQDEDAAEECRGDKRATCKGSLSKLQKQTEEQTCIYSIVRLPAIVLSYSRGDDVSIFTGIFQHCLAHTYLTMDSLIWV